MSDPGTRRCDWCRELIAPDAQCDCAATVRIAALEHAARELRRVTAHQYRLAKWQWNKPGPKMRAVKEFELIQAFEKADAVLAGAP